MRITGLATGLDMDKIVSDSMKPYRFKIDQTQQKRDIVEMKQMLYRDVINDSRELYNKYFDVSKPDSLLLSKNWATTKFTSSNENVLSVSGNTDAKAESYTIKGTTGTAAKAVVTTGIKDKEKMVINGKEFTLTGASEKEIAMNLNNDMKKAGVNVSVRYSDFAGTTTNQKGLIFESNVVGKDGTFTLGGAFPEGGISSPGINATAATVTGFNVEELKKSTQIKIGKNVIEIGDVKDLDSKEIEKIINTKIDEHNKKKENSENQINLAVKISDKEEITFTSTKLGKLDEVPVIDIGGQIGVPTNGVDATRAKNTIELNSIRGKTISVNGTIVDLSKATPGEEAEYLNKILEGQGIEAKLDRGAIVLTSTKAGEGNEIKVGIYDGKNDISVSEGVDSNITFTDSKGGVYKHTGNSNTVTLDGVTFTFNGIIPEGGITVNGKTDSTETKDKLVKFVEDYNVLMEKLNKMVGEKPNKKYQPLTAEQKKEMSESEVKLWNEKVKQGQLSRDSDVTRLRDSMKSIMSSMSGQLEKIGISPVGDYQGSKNGTLKIDEAKLTQALDSNPDEVMKLFIENSKDASGKETKGVMQKLKDTLYNETVTVTSSLIKKAGIENSATSSNNDLTRSIEKYNKKMADLEKDFARREQALYSKYARLEVSMNKYNSQQSMMAQQFGGQ